MSEVACIVVVVVSCRPVLTSCNDQQRLLLMYRLLFEPNKQFTEEALLRCGEDNERLVVV